MAEKQLHDALSAYRDSLTLHNTRNVPGDALTPKESGSDASPSSDDAQFEEQSEESAAAERHDEKVVSAISKEPSSGEKADDSGVSISLFPKEK